MNFISWTWMTILIKERNKCFKSQRTVIGFQIKTKLCFLVSFFIVLFCYSHLAVVAVVVNVWKDFDKQYWTFIHGKCDSKNNFDKKKFNLHHLWMSEVNLNRVLGFIKTRLKSAHTHIHTYGIINFVLNFMAFFTYNVHYGL